MSADRHAREKEAGATVAGGGAAQGGYQASGYGTKHYVDRHTRKGGKGVTPTQVNMQDKVLKPLKSRYGMRLPKGHPERNNAGYHRAYPKQLPHARKIRALGHTHEGRWGMAVGGATTLAGGASGALIERHRLKKNEEPPMTKSAFGVELAKYDAGTITYHQEAASMHGRKKASGRRQVAGGVAIGTGGVAAHMNAPRLATAMADRSSWPGSVGHARDMKTFTPAIRRGGVGLAAAGGTLAAVGAGRAIHHGRKQNAETGKAQAARRERNASMAAVGKSAFGVEDDRIAKSVIGEALDMGSDALKGLKGGISGKSFGAAPASTAGMFGAKTGKTVASGATAAKGALTPLVNSPAKAATAGGIGGLGVGMGIKRKSN